MGWKKWSMAKIYPYFVEDGFAIQETQWTFSKIKRKARYNKTAENKNTGNSTHTYKQIDKVYTRE